MLFNWIASVGLVRIAAKHQRMGINGKSSTLALFLFLILPAPKLWAQGPPFQTDDPVPVDLHHYEFYIFGAMDGTPAEYDSTGPAFEFNWGAIPKSAAAHHRSLGHDQPH